MAELEIISNFHSNKAEVLADIAKQDLWPSVYVSERMDELPLHWHSTFVCGYVLEGESYILNEQGDHLPLKAGDKLVLPAGVVHAEGKVTSRMVYIVATEQAANLLEALDINLAEKDSA